ncbi:metabotropic glutamate receptor 2 [Dermacentor silvarum]|uniref:metabotropic glutamate receptor 2 n=1 Tax=Dermacentor silvarum TaxID=543639 RepID=UPI00189A80B2|nr:metabotropic glutamate receptor 2 [Dermacentor silvarum]XP_049520280.1 metabotropic glutamate receptor 2 [Dermacentor silvarum]
MLRRPCCSARSLVPTGRALVLAAATAALAWRPVCGGGGVAGWPIQRMTNFSGDILLGALFPVHERNATYECGRIQDEGVEQLEALLFTLHKINNDSALLPGVSLGVLALDSCDSTEYALEQSLDFVKGFIARSSVGFACADGSSPAYRHGAFDRVVGVIGGQSSAVSIQLANLLRLFRVPQVSYQSTSPTLSNKHRFGYFFRTVPSDVNQAHAILELLRAFHWTYVSVVYSDTDYGNKGYDKLQELAARYRICLSNPQSIPVDHYTDADYDAVIRSLTHRSSARVVVVFADKGAARSLMRAAWRRRARFVWIGSDAWSGLESVAQGHEEVVEGSITVSPMVQPLNGFERHFSQLTPDNNALNPWFPEYWEEKFQCRLPDFQETPFNNQFRLWCPSAGRRLRPGYRGLQFVRDAAYAFAHALHDMQRDRCGPQHQGLCASMAREMQSDALKRYLEKVSFKDEGGKTFRFLPSGDAPPRYSILNFQRLDNDSAADGGQPRYAWRHVGSYSLGDDGEAKLDLDLEALRFKADEPRFPHSFCSAPCRRGQAKLQLEGDTCCWLCSNCSQYQFLADEFHCRDCPLGTVPDPESKARCLPLPEEFLSYGDPWAIAALAVAALGAAAVVFVALVFRSYADTPVVKASGRELSSMLLLGLLMSYALTPVIVAKPSAWSCALTRFFLGLCYAICYAALLCKTIRTARIFGGGRRRLRYTSPRSQLLLAGLLISVQATLGAAWLMLEPPSVAHVYPSRARNVLVCQGSDRASYLLGLVYPSLLIGVCTVYAFKTRKCPEGFNEARHLAFANYTTCVIWLAFLPLFLLSGSPTIRTLALSFLLSLSGAVQTACLFAPKVYIALCKPAKNTREGVMSHHHGGRCAAVGCAMHPPLALNNLAKADNLDNMAAEAAAAVAIANVQPHRGQSKTL